MRVIPRIRPACQGDSHPDQRTGAPNVCGRGWSAAKPRMVKSTTILACFRHCEERGWRGILSLTRPGRPAGTAGPPDPFLLVRDDPALRTHPARWRFEFAVPEGMIRRCPEELWKSALIPTRWRLRP